MKSNKIKTIAYWTSTILGPTSFVIGGAIALTGGDQVVGALNHLGYPVYFASLLGVWKLLGAVVLTVPGLPRLKEWAYAGFVFDLTAAAFSHASVGDRGADIFGPLLFLGLVLASWALRPASRKLTATPAPREAAVADAFVGVPVRA
jgi:hypothetical protein